MNRRLYLKLEGELDEKPMALEKGNALEMQLGSREQSAKYT